MKIPALTIESNFNELSEKTLDNLALLEDV